MLKLPGYKASNNDFSQGPTLSGTLTILKY